MLLKPNAKDGKHVVQVMVDANWADDAIDRKSTSGGVLYMYGRAIATWSSPRMWVPEPTVDESGACETWSSLSPQRSRGRERRRAALALDVSRSPKHLPFASPEPSKASGKATCKLTWASATSSEALRTPKQEPVQSREQFPGWCVVLRIMGGRLFVDCTPRFRASHTHRRRDTRVGQHLYVEHFRHRFTKPLGNAWRGATTFTEPTASVSGSVSTSVSSSDQPAAKEGMQAEMTATLISLG